MEQKIYRSAFSVKANAEEGDVSCAFATMNVIDHDGDVTLPGAFGEQKARLSSWGHNWQVLPVGRGTIREEEGRAIFDGSFFLDTIQGKEHYTTIKHMDELQEWSYGFDILNSIPGEMDGRPVRFLKSLRVHEVSPVMLGAGIDTQTLAIKGDKDTRTTIDDFEALVKAGRRNSAADLERMQTIMRLMQELMDEAEANADEAGDGKSAGKASDHRREILSRIIETEQGETK